MEGRAYTVAEIDALRAAVWRKYRIGQTYKQIGDFAGWVGRARVCPVDGHVPAEAVAREAAIDAADAATAEDYLRTHMLAGHTADDLLDPLKAAE